MPDYDTICSCWFDNGGPPLTSMRDPDPAAVPAILKDAPQFQNDNPIELQTKYFMLKDDQGVKNTRAEMREEVKAAKHDAMNVLVNHLTIGIISHHDESQNIYCGQRRHLSHRADGYDPCLRLCRTFGTITGVNKITITRFQECNPVPFRPSLSCPPIPSHPQGTLKDGMGKGKGTE